MSFQETTFYTSSLSPAAVEAVQSGREVLDGCLRKAAESEVIGWEQLQVLESQGEQVDRCTTVTSRVHQNLGKSEKKLRFIESVWGTVLEKLRPNKRKATEQDTAVEETARARKDLKKKLKIEQQNCTIFPVHPLLSSPPQTIEEAQFQEMISGNEERLDRLASILSVVKQQSVHMGKELDRQADALDKLSGEVSRAESRTAHCVTRIRALY